MNLQTAASIGMGLIKHRQEIGTALGGLSGLGKLVGGEGFGKIASQFGLKKEMSAQIGQAIEANLNAANVNTLQALGYFNHFDADKNGEVSKAELTQGLQQLEAAGLTGGQFQKLHSMGQMLLKNYEQVAQLDGNAGSVSLADLGKLANRDGNVALITPADWQSLQS